jgi:hypothetical protein
MGLLAQCRFDAYFGERDLSFRLNLTVAQCEVLRA